MANRMIVALLMGSQGDGQRHSKRSFCPLKQARFPDESREKMKKNVKILTNNDSLFSITRCK